MMRLLSVCSACVPPRRQPRPPCSAPGSHCIHSRLMGLAIAMTMRVAIKLTALTLLSATPAFAADEPATPEPVTTASQPEDTSVTEALADPVAVVKAPERITPDESLQRHQAIPAQLALFQRSSEVVPLLANETAFYGLFIQERSGFPQGGTLLLHDQGQHGQWPVPTGMLREQLPDLGWATLAIELPDPPPAPLPPTSLYLDASSTNKDSAASGAGDTPAATAEAADNASSAHDNNPNNNQNTNPNDQKKDDSTTTTTLATTDAKVAIPPEPNTFDPTLAREPPLPQLTPLPALKTDANPSAVTAIEGQQASAYEQAQQQHRQQVVERIRQGIQYLKSRGQLNLVVIASGSSASWASQWLNEVSRINADGKAERGLALILIDARESSATKIPLPQQLLQLAVPVFDVITDANQLSATQLRQRAGLMRHNKRAHYQQFFLSGPIALADEHNALTRRIRGWLKSNAAGTRLSQR